MRDALEPLFMNGKIDIRVSRQMLRDLERERKRMSDAAGAEVKTSAAVRALLEQALRRKRRSEATAVAR